MTIPVNGHAGHAHQMGLHESRHSERHPLRGRTDRQRREAGDRNGLTDFMDVGVD